MSVKRAQTFTLGQGTAGGKDQRDLKEALQLTGFIRKAVLEVRGNQVATGGGAISGFVREHPWGGILLLTLEGQYKPTGKRRTIFSAPPADLYWPWSFLSGQPATILNTSTGAAATDPIRGVMNMPMAVPGDIKEPFTYIDSRDYEDLTWTVQWDTDANFATTNLSDMTSLETNLYVEEEIGDDLPPAFDVAAGIPGHAHWEPAWVQKRIPMTTSEVTQRNDNLVSWDGFATALFLQQHDDSASGNSERVNGLLKFLSVQHKSRAIFDRASVNDLLRKTQEEFPLALSTTQPDGVYAIPLDPNLISMDGPVNVVRDTTTTPPPGITAVTPAASDALVVTLLVNEPTAAMQAILKEEGVIA